MVRTVPLRSLLAALLLLAACSGDDVADPGPTEEAAPQLTATATRSSLFDSQRTFRLELRNDGEAPVTIDTIQLASPLFEEEAASDRDTQLAGGQQLLLPLPYGESTCPGGDEPAVVVAEIGGEAVEVPLAQYPEQVMDDVHEVECAEAAVRDAADLAFGDAWTSTGPRSASGVVEVVPRGSAEVSVDDLAGNIVFGVRLGADVLPATTTFPVELVVDRCDTHALIESKRTFKFPMEVALDGGEPAVVVLEAEVGTPARRVFADLIQACIG